MIATTIGARDLEVFEDFATRVRCFSLPQLSRAYWGGDFANARRRLNRFCDDDVLGTAVVLAATVSIDGPCVTWKPGEPLPDAAAISYQLQSRWTNRPSRHTRVYFASDRTLDVFGVAPSPERANALHLHATHDLGFAAMFLHLRQTNPARAKQLRGEDYASFLCGSDQKKPDGYLLDENEQPLVTMEFGGRYDKNRVESFVLSAKHRGPFEIW